MGLEKELKDLKCLFIVECGILSSVCHQYEVHALF